MIRASLIVGLLLIPLLGYGADDAVALEAAVERLAERIKALSASDDAFQVELASLLGSLLPGESFLRSKVESAFRARAIRLAEKNATASGRISVTFSRNSHGLLIVARIQRGDDVRVILLPFELNAPARPVAGHLERKLVWEQNHPILDVTATESELWVLDSVALCHYSLQGGHWVLQRRLEIPHAHPWPRDLRGMLHANGGVVEAYLPGVLCRADTQFRCEETAAEWPLQSGPVSLRARFETGRNFFSGFTTVASSRHPYVSPFYGAGIMTSDAEEWWILTRPDGNAYLHNRTPEGDVQQKQAGALELRNAGQVTTIPGWGSDMAVLSEACQARTAVVAAGSGGKRTDEVHAYVVLKQQLHVVGDPVEIRGTVTALWSKPDGTAIAVAHDRTVGRYAAYSLRVTCE